MLNTNLISSLVNNNEGMFFDFMPDGLVLLDSSGKRLLYFSPDEKYSDVELIQKITTFFEDKTYHSNNRDVKSHCSCELHENDDNYSPQKIFFSLNLVIDFFKTSDYFDSVLKLLHSLLDKYFVSFIVWFSSSPASWENFFTPFISQIQDHTNIAITLAGAFDKITKTDEIFLFSHDIKLIYCQYPPDIEPCHLDIVKELCEFGFRVPVLLFVTKENISLLKNSFDYWMDLNYNSGFGLPLLWDSPFFLDETETSYSLPVTRDYISLLIDVFRNYSSYDETLFPLSSFAARCFYGNWNDNGLYSVPRYLQLSISPDSGLFLCGQNFHQKRLWKNWEQFSLIKPEKVTDELLNFCAESFSASIHPICKQCHWKKLCGGQFQLDSYEKQSNLVFVCEVSRFFLRSFLWQRFKTIQIKEIP
jgi:radical SAM protein with 4Fe4S-binding SPASM domain